jgi:hypothetical protein
MHFRMIRLATVAAVSAVLGFAGIADAAAFTAKANWWGSAANSCAFDSCFANFLAVPAGKILVAQNLACHLETSQNAQIISLSLGGNRTGLYFSPGAIVVANKKYYYNVSQKIFDPFKPGQAPFVELGANVSTHVNISCQLTGVLQPAN